MRHLFKSFVPLLILALSVKNRFYIVMVKSSDSRPTQTWFISSPATSELCDMGHRGLGKCWGQERQSQPRGSPGKLSHRVWWPGYIRGTAQQPLCLASSNRVAGSITGSFWSFQKYGIWSEGKWPKASYSEFLPGNKTQTHQVLGRGREGW